MNAGRHFDEAIETELVAARVVIVVWSQASVDSRWVRAEAQEGLDHNKLIPVFLDEISPPLIFRSLQAVNLVNWDGKKTTRDFTRLVADIGSLIGSAIPDRASGKQAESHAMAQRPGARRAGALKWVGATTGVLLAVGIAGYMHLQQREDLTTSVTPSPESETSTARPALSVFRDSLQSGSAGPEMVV
ncbi:MAG: toll/interleukin-1 receptor domain-containing protein, partial [Gammaproteobacteria bacterium]|nr:toll/interleukin-1 receptor domain-containing protein [Gammaproteobacteria bacterium]